MKLFPNLKVKTLISNEELVKTIKEIKRGFIEFKNDESGTINSIYGKRSLELNKLYNNFKALIEAIYEKKPQKIKAKFFKEIYISSNCGPAFKIDPFTVEPDSKKYVFKNLSLESNNESILVSPEMKGNSDLNQI